MNSLWIDTITVNDFPTLDGDINTDVLVVGGGIAGILCAYELQKNGIDYVLIEAKRICSGITKNTTAKVTFQHGLIYNKISDKYGIEFAKLYYSANKHAFEKIKLLSTKYNCNFEIKDSYVYSLSDERILHKELTALSEIGCNSDIFYNLSLPFKTKGAVKIKDQGQFHPLKFLSAVAKCLNIYENTKVTEFLPDYVQTNRGKIKAKKVVIATHFPILNKNGGYFIKMYQHRSYVIALKSDENIDGMYVDEAIKGMSFRKYKDFIFIGGGDHRTGKNGGNYKELFDYASKYYPQSEIKYKWAAQDCITLDEIPYVGRYSEKTPDLYVISGFNKWGMTNAMAGAEIICDMIRGKENPYYEVFSPRRTVFHPQLFVNIGETLINFIKPVKPRCPHLGCALVYNKCEHSWDCPCHGSRFDEDGALVDNPASDDINNFHKKI